MKHILALVALLAAPAVCQAIVVIDTVPIGNPGNAGEIQANGIFGRVTTSFRISKTEVTNAQYVEFLNAQAATDTYNLYNISMGTFSTHGGILRSGSPGSYTYAVKPNVPDEGPNGGPYTYGDKPVVFVSWDDAARFANWMHNGQGAGNTESGTYDMAAGTITRASSQAWFIPTENEWYKAAYYDGTLSQYRDYPTNSDVAPNNNMPASDTSNSANFLVGGNVTTGNLSYPQTLVGGYTLSDSPYGTFDQGGSVWEWNETLVTTSPSTQRGMRGGGWNDTVDKLSSAFRSSASPGSENDYLGFRLATLSAGVPGDYNGNGTVDVADYVVWRKGGPLLNELDNPGTVNGQDYTEWRARFGNNTPGAGVGSGLDASPVPEPSAWLMAAVAAMLVACATARGMC